MTATLLPASLESLKLRARLASAVARDGWESPSARKAGLATLRSALDSFQRTSSSLLAGDHGGAAAAHALSDGVSVCLSALFDSLKAEVLQRLERCEYQRLLQSPHYQRMLLSIPLDREPTLTPSYAFAAKAATAALAARDEERKANNSPPCVHADVLLR